MEVDGELRANESPRWLLVGCVWMRGGIGRRARHACLQVVGGSSYRLAVRTVVVLNGYVYGEKMRWVRSVASRSTLVDRRVCKRQMPTLSSGHFSGLLRDC